MSKQPPRPYFGARTRSGYCCTSSYMNVERVICDIIMRAYDYSGGYVVNKERDVFAKVETYREYIEETNEWIEYAAVDYLQCPSCNAPNYNGSRCECCDYSMAERGALV